ncbi:MAG: S24 family peptidase [Bacteroidales bacterium]|nr:S24 family peptidase [Bacteroidales bacterium]MDT8374985.1 S24 family peptidase [Bacteroidales bacterium]
MTVDIVIAGRRIRLQSEEGVTLVPDERFRAFAVPSDVNPYMFIDTAPGILADADPGSNYAVIPFMAGETDPDLVVDVEFGAGEIPAWAVKVFDARLMEEFPGGVRNSGEPFWEVFRDDEAVRTRVFLRDPERSAVLEMPHGKMQWRIFADTLHNAIDSRSPQKPYPTDHQPPDHSDNTSGAQPQSGPGHDNSGTPSVTEAFATEHMTQTSGDDKSRVHSRTGLTPDRHGSDLSAEDASADISDITVDPLPWPLDGLLLYFLFSRAGDIMIHGSGVVAGGRGWLFTGRSGSGKTTLAGIFDGADDRVIHDDRLVLRREGGRWVMHSTPVYRNDEPRTAPLDHLWVIRHGAANVSEPVAGAEAVAMIMANCIQQNWDPEAAARMAAAADDLAASVPVSRLSFLPDGTVRDYLLLRATDDKTVAAGALLEMLDGGHAVTVTAGGYSMWPAIRPGDTVVIAPCGTSLPEAGEIAVLRRDGGYVIHRVTRVISREGVLLICTQGDAVTREDEPAGTAMIAGVVRKIIRSGMEIHQHRRLLPRRVNRLAAYIASVLSGYSR